MTQTALTVLLRWAAPPLLGAIVGYAVVAIGLRVGLMRASSRGRRAVAEGVGRLVAKGFASEDELKAQLRAPAVVEQISRGVSSLSAEALRTPVAKLLSAGAPAVGISLSSVVEGLLQRFLGSRSFIYAVRDIATRSINTLAGKKLREALSGRILAPLAHPQKRRTVARSVAEFFAGQAGALLSDDVLDQAAAFLEPSVPEAAERIIDWLKSAETRGYLSEQGRDLLPRILEKLNLLQRFLLSAGQFDRRITEKMPEIVDETIATLQGMLRDTTQQRRLLRALVAVAGDWRDGFASAQREERIEGLSGIIENLLARLEDPAVRRSLAAQLDRRLFASDPTLGSVARSLTGKRDEELIDILSAWALSFLTRKGTAEAIGRSVESLVEGTLGELLQVDERRKAGIDEYLTGLLLATVDQRLPEILKGLNVQKLVSDKIGSIDARDARRPMRIVAAVGALIGLVTGMIELFIGLVL
jgi:uncharacterized membrane-anchored protein YjiN (DUF445 family)